MIQTNVVEYTISAINELTEDCLVVGPNWLPMTGKNDQIVVLCVDRIDTCDRNACDCDKAAADCFERHRSTHDSALLTLDDSTKSAICNL
jgi:hypothetical protein